MGGSDSSSEVVQPHEVIEPSEEVLDLCVYHRMERSVRLAPKARECNSMQIALTIPQNESLQSAEELLVPDIDRGSLVKIIFQDWLNSAQSVGIDHLSKY